MPSVPSNAVLPPGSLILVTGANGLVASYVIDQLLAYGYRVRGTMRDVQKSGWLQEYFEKKYGPDKLELVCIKDLGVKGSLDEAVKGCRGMAHVATNLSFSPDPNEVIPPTIAFVEYALESAAKESGLERFVYCSSRSAADQWKINEKFDLTPESWNTVSLEAAWQPPPYLPDRVLHVYSASKAAAEKAMWTYVKEQKPHFTANAVLPDFVTGTPLSEKLGFPSSISILVDLHDGGELWKVFPPQFMIDAQDTARLHVAALIHPDIKSERVFGYAHSKTWTDWIEKFRKMYPDHAWPDPPADEGKDMSNVTAQPRAESLLQWLGRPGWTPMEDSMKEAMDAVIASKK